MSTITPPPAAVAKDAHWAAKMARLRARTLPERTLSICDDSGVKREVTDAALALAKARTRATADALEQGIAEAQREEWVTSQPAVLATDSALGAAQRAQDAATITLTFRALPRPVWEQLLRDHPPTEFQAEQGMEYNVETFPAALVSACHIERDLDGTAVEGMTEADAQELLDAWPDAEAKALFTAALLVNQTLRSDLGKG
ncbi:hypothetical protein [Streptomyces sp. NPDC001815]|uniref:hypothetical protein n=1 Tax=Streptomyces sp. NPDC001815 TaxID=3154526 RepID=UPI0033181674